MNSDNSYYSKYLKYKNKYLDLKQKISGGSGMTVDSFSMPEQVDRIRIEVNAKIVEIGDKINTGKTIDPREIGDQLSDIDRVLEQSRINSEFYQYLLNVFKELIENKDNLTKLEEIYNKHMTNAKMALTGLNREPLEWFVLLVEFTFELIKAKVDGIITAKEKVVLKKRIDELKTANKELERNLASSTIASNLGSTQRLKKINNLQSQNKELESENTKLKESRRKTDDAINRLLDFFRSKNMKVRQPVYIRR